jgi:hypothetical protein
MLSETTPTAINDLKRKIMKKAFIKLDLQFLDSLPVQRLCHREGAKGMGALVMLFEYLRCCTDCVGLLSAVPHLASECKMKQTSLLRILHDEELFTILDDDRFYCPYLSKSMNKVEQISNKSALQLTDNQHKSLYIEDRTIVKKERKKKSDSRGTVADAVPSSDIPEPGEVCTSSDGTMRVIFPDEPMGKPSPASREEESLARRAAIENVDFPPSGESQPLEYGEPSPQSIINSRTSGESIPFSPQKDTFREAKACLSEGESLPFGVQKDTFREAKACLSEGKSMPFAPPKDSVGQTSRGNPRHQSDRTNQKNPMNQINRSNRSNRQNQSHHLFKQQLCNRQNQDITLSNPATSTSSRIATRDKCAARAPYAETSERTASRRACPSTSTQASVSASSAEPNSCFKNTMSDTCLTISTTKR